MSLIRTKKGCVKNTFDTAPLFFRQGMLSYSFQKLGTKRRSIVKISSRPTTMRKDIIHFTKGLQAEKLDAGPKDPRPGPTLLTEVRVAPSDSSRGIPAATRAKIPTIKRIKYMVEKACILLIT